MEHPQYRILIADDHDVAREGIKTTLSSMRETANARIEEVSNGALLLSLLKKERFDLLIMDVSLNGTDGLTVLEYLQHANVYLSSIIFSRYDNIRMRKAVMNRGAAGFVFKSQPIAEFEKAIRMVLTGRKYSLPRMEQDPEQAIAKSGFEVPFLERASLTKRELQVLRLIAQAKNNKEIAADLFISAETVSVHRKNLMRKLGVQNKASLVRAAYAFQLLE